MVGFGYDSHRFGGEKPLIIGGILIDSEFKIHAHSDGDALFHALTDALLGAMGDGDIGEHYPDTDPLYQNADSSVFVNKTIEKVRSRNLKIINIDITIVLQSPKLSPYKVAIKNNVAAVCKLDSFQVNIKAKTNEKMGFTGRSEGIAVFCICQIDK